MKIFKFIICLTFICNWAQAQTGTVKGLISDETTGEGIPFANVFVIETKGGFATELDGTYTYELVAGNYQFEISYIGYNTILKDVEVKEGVTTVLDIVLAEVGQKLTEVVVTAKQLRNTQNAIQSIQRKSANVVNGISAESIKKAGDGNAASAIKRVTGVSVSGGKYVFVRGLGDRYSKTILNGMDIPGLDPDRNSVQMDIFPSNIIDGIMVSKTATADLSADFTGGVVNIMTKDLPEEKINNISLGIAYNPNIHFKNNYLSSEKSGTDLFGFDSGQRDLPLDKRQYIPNAIDDPTLTTLTSRFRNNMATHRTRSLGNVNFGYSVGNYINKVNTKIGYFATLGYRINTEFYQDVMFNNYLKSTDKSEMDLLADRSSRGDLGVNSVLLNGMIGTSVKFGKNTISMNALHLQSGKSKAGLFERNSFIRASNEIIRDNIEYTQSSITNVLFSGKHSLKNDFNVNWRLSPTVSRINDKDIRVTPFKINDDGGLTIEPSEGAQPRRLWRNLVETNYSGNVDISKSFDLSDRELNLKFGLSHIFKQRDYEILNYLINAKGQTELNLNGDPNQLLDVDNIWTPEKQVGTYIAGNYEPTNTYDASQINYGAYVMSDMNISENLKANVGIRIEKFTHFYTGQNNTGSIVFDNEKISDNTNFFPSVNLVYKLSKQMNLRGSYSNTIARPSFKEASIAQIYDAISDRTFIGNIELLPTNINNFDLRLESFRPGGQMFSLSGFYKTFVNPIELVAFSSSAPNDLQPRNVGNATVTGVEFEFRNRLSLISEHLKSFYIGANFTFVESKVALDQTENGEYYSRETNGRDGELISDMRQMQGQSPYIINTYLSYVNNDRTWEGNLSYNVQGSSLSVVGIGLNPDVYTSPFHDLSIRIKKHFGENNKFSISAGVNNILQSERTKVYKSYGTNDQIFEQFRPFRRYSIGLNWKI